jgi:hypothetical protein
VDYQLILALAGVAAAAAYLVRQALRRGGCGSRPAGPTLIEKLEIRRR